MGPWLTICWTTLIVLLIHYKAADVHRDLRSSNSNQWETHQLVLHLQQTVRYLEDQLDYIPNSIPIPKCHGNGHDAMCGSPMAGLRGYAFCSSSTKKLLSKGDEPSSFKCYYQQDAATGIVDGYQSSTFPDQIFGFGWNGMDGARLGLFVNRTPEYALHAMAHRDEGGELRGGAIAAEARFVLRGEDRSFHNWTIDSKGRWMADDECFAHCEEASSSSRSVD